MLGTLHDKWEISKSVDIREGDRFIFIRGKRVEVKLEEKNQLRLSLVELVDNKSEQHYAAVSGVRNALVQRRKDLAIIQEELKEIVGKLDAEELEEDVEEDLMGQARDRRALIRHHLKEIKKLETNTSIKVNYRVVKTGLTTVLSPGLTLHPKFLPQPVCWCPYDMPKSKIIEEVTTMVEEMPLTITCAQQTTAKGIGLDGCVPDKESKFIITAKDMHGKPLDAGGDEFEVESKEADIKSSVLDKKNGMYEVSYFAGDAKVSEPFSLAVTLGGRPIYGSPFSVKHAALLLEFTTYGNEPSNWLDAAVAKMSNIPRARLWVYLHDANGTEVYGATGVTSRKWTQKHITCSANSQCYDNQHKNAIQLDNGDGLMIIGKSATFFQINCPGWNAFGAYNIIINAGWDKSQLSFNHPRRMILARTMSFVPNWSNPYNRISFSSSGFKIAGGNWPKFKGTFRIYYVAL